MNIDIAYLPSQDYPSADLLCYGAAAGLGAGVFFGHPVVGCLTGLMICYGCESVVSGSSRNLKDSDSGDMPEYASAESVQPKQQFMVRTAEISVSTYLSPDQHSNGKELTDAGQSCRRAVPYVRMSPSGSARCRISLVRGLAVSGCNKQGT